MQRVNRNRIANLRRLYWDNRRENDMFDGRTASSKRRKSCALRARLSGHLDKIRACQDNTYAVFCE